MSFESEGDEPVFAVDLTWSYQRGINYRKWLIGMLASNPALIVGSCEENTKAIMQQAESIINTLDKNEDKNEDNNKDEEKKNDR